jgi:dTDP-4-dehydrorhamnose reductase
MKILLIGKNGQLGWELRRTLLPLGDITAVDYPEIDLADEANTRGWVRRVAPQVIVNAAAYTAVDKAESEPDLAMAVNGTAPGVLAEEAQSLGAALIHYSTDYVFDGTKGAPYVEATPPIRSTCTG